MQLTEREINHIIDSHVGMTESMTRDLHNAAHAIFERMKGGVVCHAEGVAKKAGTGGWNVMVQRNNSYGFADVHSVSTYTWQEAQNEGWEPVQVTVRRRP